MKEKRGRGKGKDGSGMAVKGVRRDAPRASRINGNMQSQGWGGGRLGDPQKMQ